MAISQFLKITLNLELMAISQFLMAIFNSSFKEVTNFYNYVKVLLVSFLVTVAKNLSKNLNILLENGFKFLNGRAMIKVFKVFYQKGVKLSLRKRKICLNVQNILAFYFF